MPVLDHFECGNGLLVRFQSRRSHPRRISVLFIALRDDFWLDIFFEKIFYFLKNWFLVLSPIPMLAMLIFAVGKLSNLWSFRFLWFGMRHFIRANFCSAESWFSRLFYLLCLSPPAFWLMSDSLFIKEYEVLYGGPQNPQSAKKITVHSIRKVKKTQRMVWIRKSKNRCMHTKHSWKNCPST